MRKRSLAITSLVIALLFSAWGNVVAAAFCPCFASDHSCCVHDSRVSQQSVAHMSRGDMQMEDMDMSDLHMGDMQMEAALGAEPNADAPNVQIENNSEPAVVDVVAFTLPRESCTHCLSHSQSPSGPTSVAGVDPAKRPVERAPAIAMLVAVSLIGFPSPIAFLGHGPPGESFPRHILISVFRI